MTQKDKKNLSEESILEQLKDLIVLLHPDLNQDSLKVDIPILGDGLGLDSIRLVNLIVSLEEKYSFSFSEEDLTMSTFSSLRALAKFIMERITP